MRLFCDPFSRTPNGRHSPSPPDTKAFLYFSTPPGKPRIAGELRLRVASSDDYASFESGSDLESNGQPWSLPLCTLSKYSTPNILYEKLREEQLVPNDLDKVLSSFPDRCLRYRQVQVLYTLNDTFIANFGPTKRSFNIITEQGAETLLYSKVFFDWRIMSHPYTGAYKNYHLSILLDDSNKSIGNALARFERSTLPEHKGTRTVVLRFLKIVTPVKCVLPLYDSHIVPPQEGELYRRTLRSFQQRVWSVNIDKQKCGLNQRLRLLWEA